MRRSCTFVLLLAVVCGGVATSALLSAPAPRETRPHREGASEKGIQGTWVIVRFEADGEADQEPVGERCAITANNLRVGDGPVQSFKVDPTKDPKWFDARAAITKDFPFPYGMVGIYKIEKDALTLCYCPPKQDAVRPTAFKLWEHGNALMVLKRAGGERK
jgi:uncharacterized protein (TIGR03067 family)